MFTVHNSSIVLHMKHDFLYNYSSILNLQINGIDLNSIIIMY